MAVRPAWGALRPWIPALLGAATIFVLSAFPGTAYPLTDIPAADKLVHVGVYAALGALVARGFARGTSVGWLAGWGASALLATFYGMTDELHQRFVPMRNADWQDVVADAIGALLGAGVMTVVAWRWHRGRPRVHR